MNEIGLTLEVINMKLFLSNIYPPIITISLKKCFDQSKPFNKEVRHMEIIILLIVAYLFDIISILKAISQLL